MKDCYEDPMDVDKHDAQELAGEIGAALSYYHLSLLRGVLIDPSALKVFAEHIDEAWADAGQAEHEKEDERRQDR